MTGVPFRILPSTNHASPTGALPYLLTPTGALPASTLTSNATFSNDWALAQAYAAGVPEPTTLSLLALGLPLLTRPSRRARS